MAQSAVERMEVQILSVGLMDRTHSALQQQSPCQEAGGKAS